MEKQNKLGKMSLKGSVSHRKFQSLWNCLVSKSHALWEGIHLLIYYKCSYEPDLMALLLIPACEMLKLRNAPCLSPDWATQWLLGQSGLHNESLCTEREMDTQVEMFTSKPCKQTITFRGLLPKHLFCTVQMPTKYFQ